MARTELEITGFDYDHAIVRRVGGDRIPASDGLGEPSDSIVMSRDEIVAELKKQGSKEPSITLGKRFVWDW